MKKIKDFFYNKNDIIIVLIIVALAAFIIYTRVDAIMNYPEKMADKAETQTEQQQETNADDSGNADDAKTPADDTDKAEDAGAPADDANKTKDVSIKITAKDTSVTVAEKLEKAGAVTSATEFEGYISNSGKEDSIKKGTFTIPAGSSNEEILNIITK